MVYNSPSLEDPEPDESTPHTLRFFVVVCVGGVRPRL
jgi:hypothetical protein